MSSENVAPRHHVRSALLPRAGEPSPLKPAVRVAQSVSAAPVAVAAVSNTKLVNLRLAKLLEPGMSFSLNALSRKYSREYGIKLRDDFEAERGQRIQDLLDTSIFDVDTSEANVRLSLRHVGCGEVEFCVVPSIARSRRQNGTKVTPVNRAQYLAFTQQLRVQKYNQKERALAFSARYPLSERSVRYGPVMNIGEDIEQFLAVLPTRVAEELSRVSGVQGNPHLHNLVDLVLDISRPAEALFVDHQTGTKTVAVLSPCGLMRQSDIRAVLEHDAVTHVDPSTSRAGITDTLHRIGVIYSHDNPVGLTMRMGKAVLSSASAVVDVVLGEHGNEGNSVLLLGPPGSGKTTLLRMIARLLANAPLMRSTVIVDTSGEIAGQGTAPHAAIGRARRMHVPSKAEQAELLSQAVCNHTPDVLVVDEISSSKEVREVASIARRGVQIVATAHGNELRDIIFNPELQKLIGGVKNSTLSDIAMKKRKASKKTILERCEVPVFDAVIEVRKDGKILVINDLESAVDAVLAGKPFQAHERQILSNEPAYGVKDLRMLPFSSTQVNVETQM